MTSIEAKRVLARPPVVGLYQRARRVGRILPGIVVCMVLAVMVIETRRFFPEYVADSLLAVLAGLILGNLVTIPHHTQPGLTWMSRTGLRLAIVLMGARLTFSSIVRGGGAALLLLLVTMSVGAGLIVILGRRAKLPPRLTTLLAVGTAICGNSAIVATAPLIDADDREVAFAVATITLFGTLAVFAFPLVGHLINLPPWHFGLWAGAAINDTSQVLAAGTAYGTTAGTAYGTTAAAVATIVKLTRNALMAPILIVIGILRSRAHRAVSWHRAVLASVPLFVIGFLIVAGLNSLGLIPNQGRGVLQEVSRLLLLGALVGIGLLTKVGDLRTVGLRPFVVGCGAAVGLAATTLALTTATRAVWIRVFMPF